MTRGRSASLADAAQSIAAVALAAGAGSRFGYKPKSLLQRDGEPLLARQLRLLREAGVAQTVVVLGHHAARIEPVLRQVQRQHPRVDLSWVVNPAPDDGPGSSLRCGLAALPADLDGVLVVLGDLPLLEAADIVAVMRAWRTRAEGIDLLLPTHQGEPGHPLVFGVGLRRWLAAKPALLGVRHWRREHPAQVQTLPVDHGRCTTDVDTPDDVSRLAREQGVALQWPDGVASAP